MFLCSHISVLFLGLSGDFLLPRSSQRDGKEATPSRNPTNALCILHRYLLALHLHIGSPARRLYQKVHIEEIKGHVCFRTWDITVFSRYTALGSFHKKRRKMGGDTVFDENSEENEGKALVPIAVLDGFRGIGKLSTPYHLSPSISYRSISLNLSLHSVHIAYYIITFVLFLVSRLLTLGSPNYFSLFPFHACSLSPPYRFFCNRSMLCHGCALPTYVTSLLSQFSRLFCGQPRLSSSLYLALRSIHILSLNVCGFPFFLFLFLSCCRTVESVERTYVRYPLRPRYGL